MNQKRHAVWLLKKQSHMEKINDMKNISYYIGRKHADYFPPSSLETNLSQLLGEVNSGKTQIPEFQ